MEELRQLFYLSRAGAQITDSDVRQILLTSQRNNRRGDITGCLLYSGKHFAQVLEGRPAALDQLVARISEDKRHTDLLIVIDHKVTKRRFPGWSMGILYKLYIEDQLEAFLAGGPISSGDAVKLLGEMNPDTVMGDL